MNSALHAALHDQGGLHKRDGRLAQAERALRAALQLAPNDAKTRHALGIVLLSQGRYAEGWPFYDARHEIVELGLFKPDLPYPEWQGQSLSGKRLLIFHEQGLGDQIMFARFAPHLRDMGADVTLFCHPLLSRLFDFPGIRVLAASGPVEFPDPDYWIMSGSVAGRLLRSPADIPNAPYLPSRKVSHAGIGVVTKGNPRHTNDHNRSLSERESERLLKLPGAFSLAPEDTGAKDFAETAELISGLDCVVTVDTSVAHLAGAMGKSVRILVPSVMTDWRWMERRSDSPWYPSARLYRHATHDRVEVVERLIADLS